jgi:hypothetical protein
MKPNRWWPILFLCVSPLALAAPRCDPEVLLDRFRSELKQQDWNNAQKESFALQALQASGHAKNLFDFIDAASGGSYSVEARRIIDGKVLQTTVLPGGVSRDRVERLLITVSERRPITERLAEPAGKLGSSLAAWQLGMDLVNAIQGDDGAKLKLVKAAYDRQFNVLTAMAETRYLRLAMSGVAVLDYLLTDFMQSTLEKYDEYWWRHYVAYHEREHKVIVGGPHSWTGILESGGHAAVEKRLNSFWENTLANSAENRTKLIEWRNDASAFSRLQKGFAARYYRDYLHASFKTYFERQARDASYEAFEQAIAMCKELDATAAAMQAARDVLGTPPKNLGRLVMDEDIDGVRRALAAGADVNQLLPPENKALPLIWGTALVGDRPKMAQILDLLLATGKVSTVQPSSEKDSLVARALTLELYDVARKLIRAGFPWRVNANGEPMLASFAQTGSVGAVRLLLDAGIEPNQARTDGGTALLYAANGGHLDTVRLLVERGADPARANRNGVTPLRIAEHRNHQAVADYLRGLAGETAKAEKDDVLATDSGHTARESPLRVGERIGKASRDGDWATVRELVERRPDGLTQCVSAAEGGRNPASRHCGGVGVLISSVVLANALASDADASLVGQLLRAHADPNHRTSQGAPMVLLAIGRNNGAALDLLLKAGADPNTPWHKGLTPLHHAAIAGSAAMVERLLTAGARPVPDADGRMPGYYLYWMQKGDAQLAERLGYADAQTYEARKHEPEFDWNGFAQAMLQGAGQMVAQAQQQRQQSAAARQPAASGPSIPDNAFFQPLKPAATSPALLPQTPSRQTQPPRPSTIYWVVYTEEVCGRQGCPATSVVTGARPPPTGFFNPNPSERGKFLRVTKAYGTLDGQKAQRIAAGIQNRSLDTRDYFPITRRYEGGYDGAGHAGPLVQYDQGVEALVR